MRCGLSEKTDRQQRGFTLVEAIMVITITGILAAMVAIFIRAPIDAYVDSARLNLHIPGC